MKASTSRRASALFWALLLLLTTVAEGFGLRACPHHDYHTHSADHGGHPASPTGEAEGHRHAEGPSGGGEPAAEECAGLHSAAAPGSERAPGTAPCNHLDLCQGHAGPIIVGEVFAVPSWAQSPHAVSEDPAPDTALPGTPAFFLPFSLAPPLS